MKSFVAVMIIGSLTSGCVQTVKEIGVAPHMTPVGSGLMAAKEGPLADSINTGSLMPDNRNNRKSRLHLFSDPRAVNPGDVLTVRISINDRAKLDNSSERERKSKTGAAADLSYDFSGTGFNPFTLGMSGNGNIGANSSANGKGNTTRSENIELSVAAVVVKTLPNGNLVIKGSQEVRVNYEMRVLSIGGIVRPRDISSDNTISYEKIAEARISYGGRGRISEVQQPRWGQQLIDLVSPY